MNFFRIFPPTFSISENCNFFVLVDFKFLIFCSNPFLLVIVVTKM